MNVFCLFLAITMAFILKKKQNDAASCQFCALSLPNDVGKGTHITPKTFATIPFNRCRGAKEQFQHQDLIYNKDSMVFARNFKDIFETIPPAYLPGF